MLCQSLILQILLRSKTNLVTPTAVENMVQWDVIGIPLGNPIRRGQQLKSNKNQTRAMKGEEYKEPVVIFFENMPVTYTSFFLSKYPLSTTTQISYSPLLIYDDH